MSKRMRGGFPPSDIHAAATSGERYQTSLRQIGLILSDLFEERDEDIESAAAWKVDLKSASEFVAMRKDEGVSIATINRDLTAFNHLMCHIKKLGWIEMNPVSQFEKQDMKESLADLVPPSDEAILELGRRAPGTLSFFPAFLDASGGRVTAISMIKWSDVKGMAASRSKSPIRSFNVALECRSRNAKFPPSLAKRTTGFASKCATGPAAR